MSQLPQGWNLTKIKNITTKTSQNKPGEDEELIYVDIGSIDRDRKTISTPQKLIGKDAPSRCRKRIKTNDVLVSLTRPNLNAVAIVGEEHDDQYASTGFDVLKPNGVQPKFLYYLVRTQNFVNSISGQVQGALYPAAKASDVQAYEFAMPEFEEQKLIADKLDSVLAKVETAQARLDKIPTTLKRFRQSVLAAATSGELTKDWRQDNEVGDWQLIKVGNIVEKIEAGKNIKCLERPPKENEFGIIKISAVTWGTYNEEQSKTLNDSSLFLENRRVQVGDFLISRANTLELLGMPVIVHQATKNLMLSDKVLRLVMDETNKDWLNIFLRSSLGRKEIESRATGNQQSMRNIGQKALLDIDLQLPSDTEKSEIVRCVTELFSSADLVEKQYKAAKLRVDKLTQSILARAFSGKLFSPITEEDRVAVITVKAQNFESQKTKREQPKAIDKEAEQQTEVVPVTKIEISNEQASEVFQLLKKNNKGISAQALFDSVSDNTFNAIDDLFSELKKLIEQKVVIQAGEGENSTFKVAKK